MTIDEASSILLEKRADLQKWIDCVLNPEETYPEICAYAKALDVVLSALRTWQEHKSPCAACGYDGKHLDAPPCTNCPACPKETEENEPLTLEELREMVEQPILLETGEVSIHEQLIDIWEILTSWELEGDKFSFTRRKKAFLGKNYGITWVAYRRPPKEWEDDYGKTWFDYRHPSKEGF